MIAQFVIHIRFKFAFSWFITLCNLHDCHQHRMRNVDSMATNRSHTTTINTKQQKSICFDTFIRWIDFNSCSSLGQSLFSNTQKHSQKVLFNWMHIWISNYVDWILNICFDCIQPFTFCSVYSHSQYEQQQQKNKLTTKKTTIKRTKNSRRRTRFICVSARTDLMFCLSLFIHRQKKILFCPYSVHFFILIFLFI